MKGSEFRDIRMRLGLSEAAFATELGYTGKGKNRVNVIKAFESDHKRIPLYIARLAWLLDRVTEAYASDSDISTEVMAMDGTVRWPDWPGYSREELDNAD